VERRVDGSADDWAVVATLGADVTTYAQDGLAAGKTYLYRVRAFNAAGASEPTAARAVAVPGESTGVPAAPHLESLLVAPRAIRLAWTNVSNESGYRVERRVDGSTEPFKQIAVTADEVTRYVDEGLEPGKTYLYRVRAFNAAGNSAYSNTVARAVPGEIAVPATPTGVEATLIAPRAARVTWKDVEGESGYRVERRVDASGEEWRVVGTVGANVTSFTQDGLLAGKTYLYRVRAFNTAGASAPSAADSVRTPAEAPVPAAPHLESSLAGPRTVRLSWTNVSNETGYKVERRVDGSAEPFRQIAVIADEVTHYVDDGLEPGKTYLYRVRAFNAAGNSAYSNTASRAVAPAAVVPVAPQELRAAAAGPTVIELRWGNVSGESGYRLERRLDGTDAYTQIGTTAADVLTFRDATAEPGKTYVYRVRAFNAVGNSPYSNRASATTPAGDGGGA
jgi:predicted phage tail protein